MEKSVKILDREFAPLVSGAEISAAVGRCAGLINSRYGGHLGGDGLVLLTVLSGGAMFLAELSKHLTIPVVWGFVKCSSYGSGMSSSGRVTVTIPPTVDVRGRDVLVVEDIVDSGTTWEFLHGYLADLGARSVAIASLAYKPGVYDKPLPVDFYALELLDDFVVGYGLDYADFGRNLDGLYRVL